MRPRAIVLVLLAALAAPAPAQILHSGAGVRWHVVPYAGWVSTGRLFRATGGGTFRNENSFLGGVQVGVDLNPFVAVVANGAYARPRATIAAPGLPAADGHLGLLFADAGIQLRILAGWWFSPFGQAAIGLARWSLSAGGLASRSGTSFMTSAGGGFDVGITRSVAVRFLVRDYITHLTWDARGPAPLDSAVARNPSNNIAVSLGVRVGP